jgi:hypothetical protein
MARRFFHEGRNTMPNRRIVFSWIACAVLGSLGAGVSCCAQTAQAKPTPKAQTSKLEPACSAKAKTFGDFLEQPESQAAEDAVEKIYQAADSGTVADTDPLVQEIRRVSAIDKGLEALPLETLETAADLWQDGAEEQYTCLLYAVRNRQTDTAAGLAQGLNESWEKRMELASVLGERYQKASDDEALAAKYEPPASPSCQELSGDELKATVQGTGVSEAWVCPDPNRPLFWDDKNKRSVPVFSDNGIPNPEGVAVLIRPWNKLQQEKVFAVGEHGKVTTDPVNLADLKVGESAMSASQLVENYNNLDADYDDLAGRFDRLLDAATKYEAASEALLGSRQLSAPVYVLPPPPPAPAELHCTSQAFGNSTYTNCY